MKEQALAIGQATVTAAGQFAFARDYSPAHRGARPPAQLA